MPVPLIIEETSLAKARGAISNVKGGIAEAICSIPVELMKSSRVCGGGGGGRRSTLLRSVVIPLKGIRGSLAMKQPLSHYAAQQNKPRVFSRASETRVIRIYSLKSAIDPIMLRHISW